MGKGEMNTSSLFFFLLIPSFLSASNLRVWAHNLSTDLRTLLPLLLYSLGSFDSSAVVAPLTLPVPYSHSYAVHFPEIPFPVGICRGSMQEWR